MKRFLASILACLALYPMGLAAQDVSDQEINPPLRGIDFSINLVSGFPAYDYKKQIDRTILPGLNIDLRFYPARQIDSWMCGLLIEGLYAGSSKESWQGMKLESSSGLFSFSLINRFQPNQDMIVKPYAEFGIGLSLSTTSSTYDVYDEASFVEWFFFGKEDEVYTFKVKDHTDRTASYTAAVGILIKKGLNLQLKYNYMPNVTYVKPEGIQVQQGDVIYEYMYSDVKIISLTLGYNFNLGRKH